MLIFLKIMVFLSTTGWLLIKAISEVKEPYDRDRKPFSLKTDYWPWYWDNVGILAFGCILGFLLSHELAVPLINKFLDWPELVESAIDLTSIAIGTFAMGWILDKAYKKKAE